ncbi:BON domain-containing protein [Legionella yabuuchiae]|uniref:BON domain-containing protein n=1 Tax=Legionella yabuuchiae TaxID=376727 RepID=UPI001055B37C|nr:BON domain-containing protein [Legionella yabuuchiae]
MNKQFKLKTLAILICSSMAGYSMADDATTTNNVQNGQVTTQTTSPDAQTNGMQNGQMMTTTAAPANENLTSDVKTALSDYSGIVDVTVQGSVVHLEGELPSDTDYEKVITLAESTKGVTDVNADKLTVKDSKQPLQDTYITAKVKGALIQADVMGKDIPSWTVSVETKNGIVYLAGTVANDDEKQKIMKVVKSVNGVNQVDNQLVVGNVAPANGTTTTTTNGGMQTDTTDTTTTDQTGTAGDATTEDATAGDGSNAATTPDQNAGGGSY